MPTLDEAALGQTFMNARTHHGWLDRPIDDATLRQIFTLTRMGPTAFNSLPMRVVFVKTPAAKEQLRPALLEGNVAQTMQAPVTAIVAYDIEFHDKLAKLLPHAPHMVNYVTSMNPDARKQMAQQNATLQAGYFIIAARALGLDCGPMAGFDAKQVDAAFFPDGKWKTMLLINLGHGDTAKLYPRGPRPEFDEVCRTA